MSSADAREFIAFTVGLPYTPVAGIPPLGFYACSSISTLFSRIGVGLLA